MYVRPPGEAADERPFNLFRRMIEEMEPESRPSLAALKAAIKRQVYALALDEARALAALPKLAPDMDQRRRGLDAARAVMRARGELTAEQNERFHRVANVLGLNGVGAEHEHAARPRKQRCGQAPRWLRRTTRSISA